MYLKNKIWNEYKLWEGGEVFIESQTGSGKTTFVLDVLVPYAMEKGKEVLFLSNRYLLKEQIKAKVAREQGIPMEEVEAIRDVEEFDGITVMTYQKLQKKCQYYDVLLYTEQIRKRYCYIVYDEAHYVLQDATFNPEIFYLLLFIKAYSGTEIFLSATMGELPEFLMDWKFGDKIDMDNGIKYSNFTLNEIPKTSSIITGLRYWIWRYKFPEKVCECDVKIFGDFKELLPFINQENDEKWLIFWGNKSKMIEYRKLINVPCDLLTADNVRLKETMELVDEIRTKERFPKKVLLTTKILDNGINIKDEKVKNIVIDTEDKTEFLQMFGRKRVRDKNDTFRLFIPQKDSSYLSGLLKLCAEKEWKFLDNNYSTSELLRRIYNQDERNIILKYYVEFDGKFVCNPAGKYKLQIKKEFLSKMIEKIKIDPWAFAKEQMSWLQIEQYFSKENSISYQNYKKHICEISNFFEKYEGKQMGKFEQDEFRESIVAKLEDGGISIVKKGRIPGKKSINQFLENEGIKFCIKSNKTSKKGEETIWTIERREREHVLLN